MNDNSFFVVMSIVLVFAPATGPLLGGWLVDHDLLSWIFFLNIPIAIVGLTTGLRFLQNTPGSPNARIDIPGIILAGIGFGAILYAASIAGEQGIGWGDTRVIVSLVGGVLALALFAIIELRTTEPLLDLRLYGIPSFALANVAGLVGTIALFGAEFLLPLYLQILRGIAIGLIIQNSQLAVLMDVPLPRLNRAAPVPEPKTSEVG